MSGQNIIPPKKRGRPKKATQEQLQNIDNSLKQLNIADSLEDFVHKTHDEYKLQIFANTIARSVRQVEKLTTTSSSNGKYQPLMSEKNFQDINISPQVASSEQIESWLLSPQYFDKELRHLSQYLAYAVGQYNRAIWYLNTIKSYNYVPKFPYIAEEEENSDIYKQDWETYLKVLQKMNIKYNIPKIDASVMYDGIVATYIVETNDTISMHIIPTDHVYITSPWTFGYTFAIDLTYFDRFAMLDDQVPELIEAYKLFVSMRKALFSGEKLAPYQYYQVPPQKGWIFTFDPIHPDKVPPLTSSMGSTIDILSYKELLKNKLALDLYKVIALKIPLDKDNKNMAISYDLATEITAVVQSQLPDNMRVFTSPFDSNAIVTDQTNRFGEIIDISNGNFSASTGFPQGLFGSIEAKQGTALQMSQKVDFAYASTHMYNQYNNFVNYQVAIRTKKYHFGVKFFGNKIEEQKETEMYSGLVRTNNAFVYDLFASTGKEPYEIESCLRKENKLKKLMEPIISAFNTSDAKDAGRSSKNDSDLSDAGENTRDYGQSQSKSFAIHNCIYCGKKLTSNAVDRCFCDETCKEDYALEVVGDKRGK
jgi:hypothetical protein